MNDLVDQLAALDPRPGHAQREVAVLVNSPMIRRILFHRIQNVRHEIKKNLGGANETPPRRWNGRNSTAHIICKGRPDARESEQPVPSVNAAYHQIGWRLKTHKKIYTFRPNILWGYLSADTIYLDW